MGDLCEREMVRWKRQRQRCPDFFSPQPMRVTEHPLSFSPSHFLRIIHRRAHLQPRVRRNMKPSAAALHSRWLLPNLLRRRLYPICTSLCSKASHERQLNECGVRATNDPREVYNCHLMGSSLMGLRDTFQKTSTGNRFQLSEHVKTNINPHWCKLFFLNSHKFTKQLASLNVLYVYRATHLLFKQVFQVIVSHSYPSARSYLARCETKDQTIPTQSAGKETNKTNWCSSCFPPRSHAEQIKCSSPKAAWKGSILYQLLFEVFLHYSTKKTIIFYFY